jgi:two-component system OmpR family response regulator
MMYSVLVVDDDDFIRKVTRAKLESEGYIVLEAIDKASLLGQIDRHDIHLILLDVILNKDNGIELIAEIRKFTNAPIMMVSSKSHLFDKVIALEMGAEDYMCKPAEPKELLSRVKAHIRRYVGSIDKMAKTKHHFNQIKFGPWTIDYKTYSVKNDNGGDAGLTKDEFDLLSTLAYHPNVVFTRERLFEILKSDNFESFDRAIDVQIARIRRKLDDSASKPVIIKTIRKVGYQFIAQTEKT